MGPGPGRRTSHTEWAGKTLPDGTGTPPYRACADNPSPLERKRRPRRFVPRGAAQAQTRLDSVPPP